MAQSKMGQQFGLVEMPIGAGDHMEHAFAPTVIPVEQKHF
jgi:hypothetical protein